MKIILNKRYGGFGVSKEGYELYAKKKGLELYLYEDTFDFKNPRYIRIDDGVFREISACYFTKDFGKEAYISDKEAKEYNLYLTEDFRTDPTLIEVVEELGSKASFGYADLHVVEIPDDAHYVVEEYDGYEVLYWSTSEIRSC